MLFSRFISIMAICLYLVWSVSAQESTPTPATNLNLVIVDSAFIRSGPSDQYPTVGAVFEGDAVVPINRSTDGNWVLIPYNRGTGWIQKNLVRWQSEWQINNLPILAENVTPTQRASTVNTPYIPTVTPIGNYVNVVDAASAYVRAGPGRGYLRLGQLLPGDTVDPVARNQDTSWIMIRFTTQRLTSEFAWVATGLINWQNFEELQRLPIIDETNLTPTATFTMTVATNIASVVQNITPSATRTETPAPTATHTATATAGVTVSPTATSSATQTETPLPTVTTSPTQTATRTPSQTANPTETKPPTASPTPLPSATDTPTTQEEIIASTTPTITPVPTDIFSIQASAVSMQATNSDITPVPSTTDSSTTAFNFSDLWQTLPLEALIAGIALLFVMIYSWFYYQGIVASNRYAEGFIIERCPVCEQGHLQIDERQSRLFGIPIVRRSVRCDHCRSVLREVGSGKWRYAVDRAANPTLFARYNGREITDQDLMRLSKHPATSANPKVNPQFTSAQDDEG